MSIIKTSYRENPYAQIDKAVLKDSRISWQAKGLLGYLLAQPNNWTVQVSDLVKRSTNGRDSVYSIISELVETGYMTKQPRKCVRGRWGGVDYTVYENPTIYGPPYTGFPDTGKPDTVSPDTDSPYTEKPDVTNKDYTNKDSTNKDFTDKEFTGGENPGPDRKEKKEKKARPVETAAEGAAAEKAARLAFTDAYCAWFEDKVGARPVFTKADGVGQDRLYKHFLSVGRDKTPFGPVWALQYIFENWHRLDPFLQRQKNFAQIASNINNILDQIKNGTPTQHKQNSVDVEELTNAARNYDFS